MNDAYKTPSAKNMLKAVNLAKQIYKNRENIKSENGQDDYKIFINNGKGDSKDSSHRLRLIHDQFLQDAFKNHCIGTIYRTEKAMDVINEIEKRQRNSPNKKVVKNEKGWGVHCEHVIPNSLLIKHLFHMPDRSERKFCDFIYLNRVICAVHIEEKSNLNKEREFGGKTSSWSSSHPAFDTKTGNPKTLWKNIKPFERYIGTDLDIYCILTGEKITKHTFTMSEHYEILNEQQRDILALYDQALHKNNTHSVESSATVRKS